MKIAKTISVLTLVISLISCYASNPNRMAVTSEPSGEEVFKLILSDEEKKEFENLQSVEEKKKWIERYWRKHDPTPTTDRNEWQEEFQRRVKFAQNMYHYPNSWGFDDRGKIYVKYGEPDDKYLDSGHFLIRPNESWVYYYSIGYGLSFDFVEKGAGYYQIVRDLTEASLLDRYSEKLRRALSLYKDRAYLGGSYAYVGNMAGYGLSQSSNFSQMQMNAYLGERDLAQAQAPSYDFSYDYGAEHLPLNFQLAGFKGDDGKTRLELYFGVPAWELGFQKDQNGQLKTKVDLAVAFYDTLYNKIVDRKIRFNVEVKNREDIDKGYAIFQENFQLPPGEGTLAMRIENFAGNKLGIYKVNLRVGDFSKDSLMVSDIQFSQRIKTAQQTRKYVKNGLEVIPYPFYEIRKSQPIYIYYEIYNLTQDESGKTNYQIQCDVIRQKSHSIISKIKDLFSGGQSESMSFLFHREGHKTNANEYISLGLRNLTAEIYTLTVRVRDTNSGGTAKSKVFFKLID